MKRLVVQVCMLALTAPVLAGNMLINGDFETGDLTGWREAGPSYYSWKFQAWAALPVPAQVFSAAVPPCMMEIAYDRHTVRHVRPAGLVKDLVPPPGSGNKWAMCWVRSGWEHMGYPWISQIFHIAPGRYKMTASWDVAVWNTVGKGDPNDQWVAGMFMVHVDKDVDSYTLDETAFRMTVWDSESKGLWIHKEVSDKIIETRTGKVEVRLEYLQGKLTPHITSPQLPVPNYGYVAFDNVKFDLELVGPLEEAR